MSSASGPDESRPLLQDHVHLEDQTIQTVTPLPKAQLTALCIARLSDPISYTQIFPFINEFLTVLHVTDDPSKIGFYSGLVVCTAAIFNELIAHTHSAQESTSSVAQVLTIFHWARLSGKFMPNTWFVLSDAVTQMSSAVDPSF
jgi:hypothetical protein